MEAENVEIIAGLISGITWPIAVIVMAVIFKEQLGKLIRSIKELQIGSLKVELERLNEKVSAVESATRNLSVDIYRVSGDALRVREEIWQYIAEILDKASDATKLEMRRALTQRHLPHVGVNIEQAKEILKELGFLEADADTGEEIGADFIQAVYDFQVAYEFAYADGIFGPKTSARLKQELQKQRSGNAKGE
jgi:hypothetical protein